MAPTVYTQCTPLPAAVSRTTAMAALRDHQSMIDLNPMVQERVKSKPPAKCTPEEYSGVWYAITDKVNYLPGGLASGKVTYHACFHDLPDGLQTHCYAPLGVDIRERWSIGGSEAHEPYMAPPMGIGAPKEGLYLREDIDLRCSRLTTSFVKKNLKTAHGVLVERLVYLATEYEGRVRNDRLAPGGQGTGPSTPSDAPSSLSHSMSQRGDRPYSPSPIAHHTTYQPTVVAEDNDAPKSPIANYKPHSPQGELPGDQHRPGQAYPQPMYSNSTSYPPGIANASLQGQPAEYSQGNNHTGTSGPWSPHSYRAVDDPANVTRAELDNHPPEHLQPNYRAELE